ncbi:MAG: BTAD domain-containing putative transcriptional regulator [Actinomycetota bacterium]
MVGFGSDAAASQVLIERPRLVDALAARFSRRLSIVVGGGGAGKTTLLRQAIAGEVDHIDAFHSCTPADREDARLASELLSAVSRAVAVAVPLGEPISAIVELVLAQSPRQVAIIVDDTHVLDRTDLFRELLDVLPANGHLVLAGRRRPAIDTARLDAAGDLLEIAQDDLLMTDDEQIDFANARSIDVELLRGAEGWPAFIELAAGGSEIRSRRYLEEEALREIAPERRRALAAFALVRGGDDAIAEAVAGQPLADLIADIPLVRWEGDRARLHDLWAELLVDELDDEARRSAALAASAIHRGRSEIDAAIDLARLVDDWDDFAASLSAAVSDGVDGGLRSDQLRRWRELIEDDRRDEPIAVLIDGLIERELDPTSQRAWDLLDRSAAAFESSGEHALELTALMQLGYVSRIHADPAKIAPVLERATALAERYPKARPFLAFGEAWTAMAHGRPDLQLAALEGLHDDDLPPIWQITRMHLIAHALFNLGRPFEALEVVPRNVDSLPIPIPGALVTESQCLWYAGQPERALARRPDGMSDRHGARDRFIAGGWAALMCAFAGDVVGARHGVEVAVANLGENPSPLLMAQTQAVDTLVKIVEGRDDEAQADLRAILEFVPLGQGVAEQMLRNNLGIPYVLAPESRPFWHEHAVGPALRQVREICEAFCAAREDDDPSKLVALDWPEPGFAAATFPVTWAMEFALRGVAANRHEGRRLAAWLCENWGDPARAALRSWLDHDELGATARDVAASTPTPPDGPVEVRLLGPASVLVDDYASADPNWRRERVRALLTALVLKPATTREQLAGTLWPDVPSEKAAKSLRTTLNYLHGVLEPRRPPGDATWFVRLDGNAVALNPALDVDLWRFRSLLDEADEAEREGKPNVALPLLLQATQLWNGDLAEDLDLEILELERIHLRSRFVRASCRAAELLVASRRPAEAIEVARPALEVDRWNERTYLALADAYDAIGDHTSARAVLERGEANIGVLLAARSPGR